MAKPGQCYHCGDACDEHPIHFDEKEFCCDGCKTVYSILKENDLCTYYDLDSNPGITLKSKNFDDKYAYLDSESVTGAYRITAKRTVDKRNVARIEQEIAERGKVFRSARPVAATPAGAAARARAAIAQGAAAGG